MVLQRVLGHMVVGAGLAYAYHRLTLPLTGGSCPLMCSPWRAIAIGAVLGLLWPSSPGGQAQAEARPELDLHRVWPAIDQVAGKDDTTMASVETGVPVHVDENSFGSLVQSSHTPILLDAYADWCGPCRMLAPQLEDVARKLDGRLVVAKLDVDSNQRLAAALGIRGIPALFLIQDGNVVDAWSGYQHAEAIVDRVTPHLPAEATAAR